MKFHSLILAATLIATPCFAEPPDLDRGDAKKILEAMEWKEVNVIAIRQGLNEKGEPAPIYATILGFAYRDGKNQQVAQTVVFDKEIGWHHLALQEKSARIWTKDGYREIKVWTTWWNGTSSTPLAPERPEKK